MRKQNDSIGLSVGCLGVFIIMLINLAIFAGCVILVMEILQHYEVI